MNPFKYVQLGFKFAVALIRHVTDGVAEVTEEQYDARLNVCAECPERTDDWKCKVCKCHLELKAAWRSEGCPQGRWPLIVVQEDVKPAPPSPPQKCGSCRPTATSPPRDAEALAQELMRRHDLPTTTPIIRPPSSSPEGRQE
jgi:hypothetical protein